MKGKLIHSFSHQVFDFFNFYMKRIWKENSFFPITNNFLVVPFLHEKSMESKLTPYVLEAFAPDIQGGT